MSLVVIKCPGNSSLTKSGNAVYYISRHISYLPYNNMLFSIGQIFHIGASQRSIFSFVEVFVISGVFLGESLVFDEENLNIEGVGQQRSVYLSETL